MAIELVSFPAYWRLSDQPAFIQVHTDKGDKADIRVTLAVIRHATTGNTPIGSESLTPDANGICVFEVGEYFPATIKPGFNYINPEGFHPSPPLMQHKTNASAFFHFIIQEFYDGELSSSSIVTPTLTITKGKIPQWALNAFEKLYGEYMNRILIDKTLTLSHLYSAAKNIPHRVFCAKTDPQRIPVILLNPPAITALHVIKYAISIIFTNNTTAFYMPTIVPEGFLDDCKHGHVLELATGYNEIGLDTYVNNSHSGKTIQEYTLRPVLIKNGSNTFLSHPITYVIDHNHQPQRRHFFFLNSLGAYDTVSFNGESESEVDYQHEIIDTPFWPGSNQSIKRSLFSDATETIKCNTGFVSRDQLNYLPEFFKSTEVYELVDGIPVPVTFTNQKLLRHTDNISLYHIEFEYQHTPRIPYETYTIPDPPPPPPPPELYVDILGHAVDPDTNKIIILGETNADHVQLQIKNDSGSWVDHGSEDTGANFNNLGLEYTFSNAAFNVGDLLSPGIIAHKPAETHYLLMLALAYPTTGGYAPWLNAKNGCIGYNAGNFTNWRLPNRVELQTIRHNIYLSYNHLANLVPDMHWTGEEEFDAHSILDYIFIEEAPGVFWIEISPPSPWPFANGQYVTIQDATGDYAALCGQWVIADFSSSEGKILLMGNVPDIPENPSGNMGNLIETVGDKAYGRVLDTGVEVLWNKSIYGFARPVRIHTGASQFQVKAWLTGETPIYSLPYTKS